MKGTLVFCAALACLAGTSQAPSERPPGFTAPADWVVMPRASTPIQRLLLIKVLAQANAKGQGRSDVEIVWPSGTDEALVGATASSAQSRIMPVNENAALWFVVDAPSRPSVEVVNVAAGAAWGQASAPGRYTLGIELRGPPEAQLGPAYAHLGPVALWVHREGSGWIVTAIGPEGAQLPLLAAPRPDAPAGGWPLFSAFALLPWAVAGAWVVLARRRSNR